MRRREALRGIRAVLDHPPRTVVKMPEPLPSTDSPPARPATRRKSRRAFLTLGLAGLGLVAACGFGGEPTTPTVVPSPTPAPRPTAESPAAVNGWYLAE